MLTRYIYDYVCNRGYSTLEYYDDDTLEDLNDYIANNVDTSEWERGDPVRVSTTDCCETVWYGVEGLFYWNGYSLIYPFYNGKYNKYGTSGYEVDQQLDCLGYIPNVFQAIHDYSIEDALNLSDGPSSKIMFTDLSDYTETMENNYEMYGVPNNAGDHTATAVKFGDYAVFFFGEMCESFWEHVRNNRPYDLDIQAVIDEYGIPASVESLKSHFNLSDSDHLMFIHPKYFCIDYNFTDYDNDSILHRIKSSRNNTSYNSKGYEVENSYKNTGKSYKYSLQDTRVKCIGKTGRGKACTRFAKNGQSYCGIHLRSMQESEEVPSELRCICQTGKGTRCNRSAKNGYDYCSLHLRIYG